MNKLTEKDTQGNWSLKGVAWEDLHEGKVITREIWEKLYGALWKLMEYEDIGMEPNEVESMNDFVKPNVIRANQQYAEIKERYSWIPVTEKLPPDELPVLVTVSGKPQRNIGLDDAVLLAEYWEEGVWSFPEYPDWAEGRPTAWMPIPEAYRETKKKRDI